jgi:hypothetical protein
MTDSIVRKVQALLERAAHENTNEHERKACMDKANELMTKYAIDQANLDAQAGDGRRQPTTEVVTLFSDEQDGGRTKYEIFAYRWHFQAIFEKCAELAGVKLAGLYGVDRRITMVGFPEDIAWAHMLYTHIFSEFIAKMFPTWSADRTFDENVRMLKESGRSWADIWLAALGAGQTDRDHKPDTVNRKNYWRAAYKRACRDAGVEPSMTTQRHDAWRYAYADSFSDRIQTRLWGMIADRKQTVEETGSALVLAGAEERINSLLFELFPDMSPEAEEERRKAAREYNEKVAEERARMLEAMTPRQREAFLAKEERAREAQRRKNHRDWEKIRHQRNDTDGHMAGARAADEIDLARPAERVADEPQAAAALN